VSRVLVLTDDIPFGTATEELLRGKAHKVRIWRLASFDTDLAREFGADVIVLDTPGNGAAYSLRQRLLRDRSLAAVPLVVLTADAAEAQLLSAQAMMTKPVEPTAFAKLLERLSSQVVF
jgi:DNA-binding response OmpR family regulator